MGEPGWLPPILAAMMVYPPTTPVKEMKLPFATVVKPVAALQLVALNASELLQDTDPPDVSESTKSAEASAFMLPVTTSAALRSARERNLPKRMHPP
jgi:hypothetical protein